MAALLDHPQRAGHVHLLQSPQGEQRGGGDSDHPERDGSEHGVGADDDVARSRALIGVDAGGVVRNGSRMKQR